MKYLKRWRRLVHDARYLRRFRELHGVRPPLLGFFNDHPGSPLFVPTTGSFGVSAAMRRQEDWWALDCRHGRALLGSKRTGELLVWDLMTGEKQHLRLPPACDENWDYNHAVLCAAGYPHHGDCRSCPFLVAVVSSHQTDFITSARVYSSKTSVWGEVTSIATPHSLVANKPTALVGNTLYWLSDNSGIIIIELDLDKHSLGLIEDVPDDALYNYDGQIIIMPVEDGRLGFAGVDDGLSLHLWARVANIDGVVTWTLCRVIDLENFLAPEVLLGCIYRVEPIGFAEDADVIFINVHPSTYMINLKSMHIEVVSEEGNYWRILPYTSFYATGTVVFHVVNFTLIFQTVSTL